MLWGLPEQRPEVSRDLETRRSQRVVRGRQPACRRTILINSLIIDFSIIVVITPFLLEGYGSGRWSTYNPVQNGDMLGEVHKREAALSDDPPTVVRVGLASLYT